MVVKGEVNLVVDVVLGWVGVWENLVVGWVNLDWVEVGRAVKVLVEDGAGGCRGGMFIPKL